MGRQVIVSIKGVQYEYSGAEPTEVVSGGEYCEKNGIAYITYVEVVEGEVVNNTIKVESSGVEIIKRGKYGTHMVFREGESSVTCYSTPLGDLSISIVTSAIFIRRSDHILKIEIEYDLDINNAHVSKCLVNVCVKDKDVA